MKKNDPVTDHILFLKSAGEQTQKGLPVLTPLSSQDPIIPKLERPFSNPVIQAILKAGKEMLDFPQEFEGKIPVAVNWDQPLAKQGFYLEKKNYARTHFVTLETSETSLENGEVEEIFAHEFSHVVMLKLLGEEKIKTRFLSTRMHLTTSTTDEALAFFEGFGNHLQPLSQNHTVNPAFSDKTNFQPYPQKLWCCSREDRLRLTGIPSNMFIHPPAEPVPLPDNLKTWYTEHITSTCIDEEKLKNPNQMLASEGVMATFFYLLAKKFINSSNCLSLENYFHNIFTTFQAMQSKLEESPIFKPSSCLPTKKPLIIHFLQTWRKIFPETYKEVWQVFLETTRFQSFSCEFYPLYQQAYRAGKRGEIKNLQNVIPNFEKKTQELLEKALSSENPAPLYQAPLWLKNENFQVSFGLWMDKPRFPLTFDLNAAELFDLMTIKEMDLATARKIIEERKESGLFSSLEDVFRRVKPNKQLQKNISSMASSMTENPPFNYF